MTEYSPSAKVRAIRETIDHPVIDADGHLIEYLPSVRDNLRELAGANTVRRFDRHYWTMDKGYRVPGELRRRFGISQHPWWTFQAQNSLDRATSMLPALQFERMPELGIDFAVCYPSYFIQFPVAEDDEFRQAGCRAVNMHLADIYQGLEERLMPVATIPMNTPEEALAELKFAVEELKLRAVVMQGVIQRKVPGSDRTWIDGLGYGSAYDYDPVWKYCEDNGIAATFHSSGMNWGSHSSVDNFMYNHVGHFAAAGEATARSLLFGGVPKRFPKLRFAFLEGGVAWAGALFGQFAGNFSKRALGAADYYNPVHLDHDLVSSLFDRYASSSMARHADELRHAMLPLSTPRELVDEFAASGFESIEDIARTFATSLFFGCEGDDPMNALATESFAKVLGTRINTIYGSDVGHWDVRDMREVLEEVYELVDDGVYTLEDFRGVVFDAPVRLWTDNNPKFFAGTSVDEPVRAWRAALDAQEGVNA